MKVLSVQHYPVFGGPHNEILRLEPFLRRAGVETIVAHTNEPGNAVQRIEGSVQVHELALERLHMTVNPLRHARTLVNMPGDIARLRRLIRELEVDLVKVHGPHNPHGAIAARLEGKPIVWVVSSTRVPRAFRRMGAEMVKRLADVILVTGEAVIHAYPPLSSCRDRVVTYYPPVSTDIFVPSMATRMATREQLGLASDALVVGMVGNINPQKGIEYFVRAAAQIKRKVPEARFLLVGAWHKTQRAYSESIQAEIDALGLGESIVMPGSRGDVENIYPAMDVSLLTSVPESEGAPTAVIEAMACGVPVVSTNVGAVSELVENGRTGFIVEPCDVDGLSRQAVALLQTPEARQKMGSAARQRAVQNFDVKRCTETHLTAYELALDGRTPVAQMSAAA